MPLVPAAGYDYRGAPSVATPETPPNVYQNIRTSPDTFGAQVGQAAEGAGREIRTGGNELAQAAISTQQLHNQIASDAGDTQFMKESHEVLFGNPATGDVGFFGKRGKDATDSAKGVGIQLDEIAKRIEGGLANPRQRLEFNQNTRRLRTYIDRDILTHYEKETQTYGQEVQKVASETAVETAGLYYSDENRIQQATEASDKAAVRYAEGLYGKNASTEVKQKFVNDGRDKIAAAVVEGRLAHNDPMGAKKWLDDHAGFVTDPRVSEILNKKVHDKAIQAEVVGDMFGVGKGATVTPQQTEEAGRAAGIPPELARATAKIESDFGANVGASGKYSGNIFQLDAEGRNKFSGSTSMGTPQQQLEYGTKSLAATRQDLTAKLGREPSNFETYLAHQQGVGGAVALINNPTVPAGKVISDVTGGKEGAANISGNGGDPNAPASQFVSLWRAKYASAEGGGLPSATPSRPQLQQLVDKYGSNPTDLATALTAYEHQQHILNIDHASAERARHELNEKTSSGYMSEILQPGSDINGIQARIASDVAAGKLTANTGLALAKAAEGKLVGDINNAEAKFGKGFWQAYQAVGKPLGDPDRINTVEQLLPKAGPGVPPEQALTLDGVKELTNFLISKKTVEGQSEAAIQDGMFKAAHKLLTGGSEHMLTKDPKGEEHFEQFQVAAWKLIQKYKGEGKGIGEIADLEKGPLAALLKPGGGLMRTPAEIAADMFVMLGGATAPTAPGVAPPITRPAGGVIKYDSSGNRVP